MKPLDHLIPNAIVKLKANYVKSSREPTFLTEVLPVEFSDDLPIESSILHALHKFAKANEMYVDSYHVNVESVPCIVYKADINSYWLSSKKHDSCYQPFYPTWLLSAFALASRYRWRPRYIWVLGEAMYVSVTTCRRLYLNYSK